MNKRLLTWVLPVMLLSGTVASVAPVTPVAAQNSNQDIGVQMEREYGVLSDSSREGSRMNAQLDRVVERIVAAVNQQRARKGGEGGDFQLRSAKILGGRDEKHNQVVNAFALPDGRIYVTMGLLRAIQDAPRSDDELAFVVGHEVAHVTERHSAQQQKEAVKAGLFGVLLGVVTKSRAGAAVGSGLGQAYVSSFGRKDEYEADLVGLRAMSRAGYDPEASITMLRRLQSKGEGQNKLMNGWFGSHPLTENRIDRMEENIAKLPSNRQGGANGFRSRR